jgi:hypothetical protein
LLKRHVRRFQHDGSIRQDTHILCQRAVSPTEHFVARFELRYIFANRFNRSGIVDTQASLFWFAQAKQRAEKKRASDGEVKWVY